MFGVSSKVKMKQLFCLIAIVGLLTSCGASPNSKDQSSSSDPPSGTWTGEWGPSPGRQSFVTLDLSLLATETAT